MPHKGRARGPLRGDILKSYFTFVVQEILATHSISLTEQKCVGQDHFLRMNVQFTYSNYLLTPSQRPRAPIQGCTVAELWRDLRIQGRGRTNERSGEEFKLITRMEVREGWKTDKERKVIRLYG